MKSTYLSKPNRISFRQVDPVPLEKKEVRVAVKQVGICGSDVHLFLGHRPMPDFTALGHEAIGIITEVGLDVPKERKGERVVIEPNISCGDCRFCQEGRSNICINKKVLGLNRAGCFADSVTLPSDFAHTLPPAISDADGVVIEPLAVAYHAFHTVENLKGNRIAILGLGAVGLLLVHLATNMGVQVLASDLNQNKCKLAQKFGAQIVAVEDIATQWKNEEVRAVFECAGAKTTAGTAISSAPHGATVVLLGLSDANAEFQPLKMVRSGITILPSLVYNHPQDFQQVIRLIENKVLQPGKIISLYKNFEELQEAFELAVTGEYPKIIVNINS
jgi:L-iditol 2-dehydrogenase